MQKEKLQFTIVQSALVFLWAAILILFLCRCGEAYETYECPHDATFCSWRGTAFHGAGMTPEQVNAQEEDLVRRLTAYGWKTFPGLGTGVVHLKPGGFYVGADYFTGYDYGTEINLDTEYSCFWQDPLEHEELHLMLDARDGDVDANHTRPEWAATDAAERTACQ